MTIHTYIHPYIHTVLYWSAKQGKENKKRKSGRGMDRVEVAPEMTVGSLRRFRATLIRPTQGLPTKRLRLHRQGSLETIPENKMLYQVVDGVSLGPNAR